MNSLYVRYGKTLKPYKTEPNYTYTGIGIAKMVSDDSIYTSINDYINKITLFSEENYKIPDGMVFIPIKADATLQLGISGKYTGSVVKFEQLNSDKEVDFSSDDKNYVYESLLKRTGYKKFIITDKI